MRQHKIKETYEFRHNDISVFVKIDYSNNKISIVTPKERERSKFTPNSFVFADRGVEYMQGWRNILEAVSEATKDAQKKYEANLAEESRLKEEFIESVVKAISKEEKNKKSLLTCTQLSKQRFYQRS